MQIKQNKQDVRARRRYTFWSWEGLSLGTFVILLVSLMGGYAIARITQQKPSPTSQPEMMIDRTPFAEWVKSDQVVNDLENHDGVLTLSEDGYRRQWKDRYKGRSIRDPQGYIQSPKPMPENVFVCTKVLSQTSSIDFSFRLNNKLQVIHGDGDDRTIALKKISGVNANGEYIKPNDGGGHVDRLNRFHLDVSLPIGKEFTSCLTITAPEGKISKQVRVDLLVLDDKGNPMKLGPMPSWIVEAPEQTNGNSGVFSVGLIDSRNGHPIVELRGYCAVAMSDWGDRPSDRERKACINP
ncbi:MAG: hypothetical protein V1907_03570 [Candidatus Kerfeldbacteria bacterium]